MSYCEQIRAAIESSSLPIERKIKALVGLSFPSQQLKHMLRGCQLLLELADKCQHKGKKVEIDEAIRELTESSLVDWQLAGGVGPPSEPSFSNELLKKTKTRPEFFGAIQLISVVTGQPYADTEEDLWRPNDKQPTALENLYAIVYSLRKASIFVQHESGESNRVRFINCLALDQSAETYITLLDLLTKTKALVESKTDRERELAEYLFDGFSTVLLNNLKALFESERAHLAFIFECLPKNGTTAEYVQSTFYPELLKMLLWRMQKSA